LRLAVRLLLFAPADAGVVGSTDEVTLPSCGDASVLRYKHFTRLSRHKKIKCFTFSTPPFFSLRVNYHREKKKQKAGCGVAGTHNHKHALLFLFLWLSLISKWAA
jgi:hypothetical protein